MTFIKQNIAYIALATAVLAIGLYFVLPVVTASDSADTVFTSIALAKSVTEDGKTGSTAGSGSTDSGGKTDTSSGDKSGGGSTSDGGSYTVDPGYGNTGCCDNVVKDETVTNTGGGSYTVDPGYGNTGCCNEPDPTPDPTPDPEDYCDKNPQAPQCNPDSKPPVCNWLTANGKTGQLVLGSPSDVLLKWSTTRATQASLTPDGSSVSVNGSKTVYVDSNTTYVLVAKNSDGQDSCSVKIVLDEEQPLTCQDVVFTSSKNLVNPGETVTLSWIFTGNVTGASLSPNVADPMSVSSVDQVINNTVTYYMTISNAKNQKKCPLTIEVKDSNAPKCVSFVATPNTLPTGGGSVTLKWETENADQVSIDNGIGVVAANDEKSVTVTNDITYTMTVSAAGYQDVTCPASIKIEDENKLTCDDVSFTASDTSVREGSDVTLSWSWNNDVTEASISNGIGDVTNNGSRVVNITGDITYYITIKNADSNESCPLSINAESDGGGGGSSNPRCDLDISDEKIKLGEEITLKWDTSRATEVVIEDNHGNIIVTTEDKLSKDKEDYFDGEITLKPTKDTTYTLNASRGSKDRECEVEVEVGGNITVLQTRKQEPRVAGIALTQVPYTGFEAGPALTFIFYTLLTVWALFVAYLLVIRRDSIGGVSFAGAHDHVDYKDVSQDEVSERMSKAEAYVASATPTYAPTNLPTENSDPMIGYSSVADISEETEDDEAIVALENQAHLSRALISSDAMRYFISEFGSDEAASEKLDEVIAEGKKIYPTEDGWLVINLARMEELLANGEDVTFSAPINLPTEDAKNTAASIEEKGIGSLAEAIVSGNTVAAYQMISHRPMVALADAAADLDAVYRLRKGEVATVSDMLQTEAAKLSESQLVHAISALTGALDGTYQSEEEAVKMAILKAIKAVN